MIEKCVDWDEVADLARQLHARSLRIVFTNGCFDLLHVGHVRLLQTARSFGDALVVGLNSDESVRGLKGPKRPLVPQEERAEILAAFACVDYVVVFDDPTPIELIRRVRPHIHVKGAEYSLGKTMPETAILRELGAEIRFMRMADGRSTTRLIAQIGGLA